MKSLTLMVLIILIQACGAANQSSGNGSDNTATTDNGSDNTATTDATTTTATTPAKKTTAVKTVKAVVTAVVSKTVTPVVTTPVVTTPVITAPAAVDPLTGTTWQTKCETLTNGTSTYYEQEYLEGEVTLTSPIFSDSACQDLELASTPDTLTYAVQGDMIQIGQSETAGEWLDGGSASQFTISNGTLALDNMVYTQVSNP